MKPYEDMTRDELLIERARLAKANREIQDEIIEREESLSELERHEGYITDELARREYGDDWRHNPRHQGD